MRIAFLLTCLEPRKSGVGDVTRHLAWALHELGHEALLIAIHDPEWSEDEVEIPGQVMECRFSAQRNWSERVPKIRAILEKFQPEIVSLQFVCYGFQPKGIVFSVVEPLLRIVQGWPLQMMFHELWVGAERGASLKEKIVGAVQRFSVQSLVRRLAPLQVHSSNATYVAMLEQAGIPAKVLPLPTAVTITMERDSAWLWQELDHHGIHLTEETRSRFLLFGFFGTLHPIWPPEPFLSHLRRLKNESKKQIVLLAMGHQGAGAALWDRLREENEAWSSWIRLGAHRENRISHFLHEIDYAVSTTPWEILGKSSSTVTMLEHGVPVIVNRRLAYGIGTDGMDFGEPLLIRMEEDLVARLQHGIERKTPQERSPAVAQQFLSDWQNANLN